MLISWRDFDHINLNSCLIPFLGDGSVSWKTRTLEMISIKMRFQEYELIISYCQSIGLIGNDSVKCTILAPSYASPLYADARTRNSAWFGCGTSSNHCLAQCFGVALWSRRNETSLRASCSARSELEFIPMDRRQGKNTETLPSPEHKNSIRCHFWTTVFCEKFPMPQLLFFCCIRW